MIAFSVAYSVTRAYGESAPGQGFERLECDRHESVGNLRQVRQTVGTIWEVIAFPGCCAVDLDDTSGVVSGKVHLYGRVAEQHPEPHPLLHVLQQH